MSIASRKIPITAHVDRLIELAMDEDIGHGDITTEALSMEELSGRARIFAKEPLVLAGLDLVGRVYEKLDNRISFYARAADGDRIEAGTCVAELTGNMRALLTGERTALNFLQRLSGIATHVRAYADTISGSGVRLTDTRKTTPGWRVLEKYAVRIGGAFNHRMGLYDGVLIKDNHIAACGGIESAIKKVRDHVSHLIRIEVETEDLEQVREALAAGADVIMLDNMGRDDIARAVEIIGKKAAIEVSGRVDPGRLERLVAAGVDIVSSGGLTHAARSVDLNMDIAPLK
ncbi:MAG: carboxylating nicotinate-nucleotide diphosphorylase [Desulfobacteraceae bacterium]|nr:carboxylating nicotinate-nucleotide diphosphorylase [Desulfobacteraceae bacterium]